MKRLWLILLIALASCAQDASVPSDSGIEGVVLAGPTCPVETVPPQPQCSPRPIEIDLIIVRAGSTTVVANARSGANDSFRVSLSPGTYTIQSSAKGPPSIKPQDVVVRAHAFTRVTVNADTGIR